MAITTTDGHDAVAVRREAPALRMDVLHPWNVLAEDRASQATDAQIAAWTPRPLSSSVEREQDLSDLWNGIWPARHSDPPRPASWWDGYQQALLDMHAATTAPIAATDEEPS